jgi:uncharacterized phage infection (PIP) family protein YhgE
MMEWQANYKGQIEDLMSANERYAQSSKIAAESFEKLITQTSSFTSVAEDMETLLNALQSQSENLSGYLTTFTSLIVDAQEGLPQIETRILALTTGLQDLVKGQTEQMKSLLEATATGIRDTSHEVSQLLLEGTSKTQERMGVQLEDLLNKNNAQFDRLEESMEAELNKALTSFGYQLTSLSEKFVNDYMPLTDKLRDLVTAAEK